MPQAKTLAALALTIATVAFSGCLANEANDDARAEDEAGQNDEEEAGPDASRPGQPSQPSPPGPPGGMPDPTPTYPPAEPVDIDASEDVIGAFSHNWSWGVAPGASRYVVLVRFSGYNDTPAWLGGFRYDFHDDAGTTHLSGGMSGGLTLVIGTNNGNEPVRVNTTDVGSEHWGTWRLSIASQPPMGEDFPVAMHYDVRVIVEY